MTSAMISLRLIPRRALAIIVPVTLVIGLLLARGCIVVIQSIETPRVSTSNAVATVENGWIKIDIDIGRPKDCPSQSTNFLRRINQLTGREDMLRLGVTNTTLTEASNEVAHLTLWYPVPARLDLKGGPWGFWNKAQDDCGILSWLLPPPIRASRSDIPLPITASDVEGSLASPTRFARDMP